MAFNTITIGADTYNSVGRGSYQKSTVAFGSPSNLVKVTPGTYSAKSKTTSCAVSRHLEKDVTVGTAVERRKLSVVLQMVVPDGFTASEVDTLTADISTFIDTANLTRILMGES